MLLKTCSQESLIHLVTPGLIFSVGLKALFQFSLTHDKGGGEESGALVGLRSISWGFELPELAYWTPLTDLTYLPDLLNTITIRLFDHLYRAGNFT